MSELYGPEPKWETLTFTGGGQMTRAVCQAPDHSHVPPGGQCRCGVLNLGIICKDPPDNEELCDP